MLTAKVTLTLAPSAVPGDSVGVRILNARGEPVKGCEVSLVTKSLTPTSYSEVTDEQGVALFPAETLLPENIPFEAVEAMSFLMLASVPNTNLAVWKDEVKFKLGQLVDFTLKEYREVPTFYVRFELRDIIGRDLFAQVLAQIEQWVLGWAGFKVTRVEGVGSRTVTVYFQPPWHGSPLVIEFAATTKFIIALIILVLGIIAIIVVVKWAFGEYAPAIVGLGLTALLLLALAVLAALAPKRREEMK